jgi:predicted XRE-type DNA-binding protein
MMRAANTSATLTLQDAIRIWRLRASGQAQHKIAAALGVNQGRISEVLSLKKFPEAKNLSQSQGLQH